VRVRINDIPETPEYSLKGVIAFIKHLEGKVLQYQLDSGKYTLLAEVPDDAAIPSNWKKTKKNG
jgi:hypothetical protein